RCYRVVWQPFRIFSPISPPQSPADSLLSSSRRQGTVLAYSPPREDRRMDAIQFLKQEHKKAKAGIKKVLKASPEDRGDLWTDLEPELEAHEQIEDAC